MGEVDRGGLLAQGLDLAAGILVARLEGLERGNRLAAEAERRDDLGPVELERGAFRRLYIRCHDKISSLISVLGGDRE